MNKEYENLSLVWESLASPSGSQKRAYHSSTLFKNSIIVFGGYNGGMEALNDIMVYNITQNTWFPVTPTGDIPAGKYGHTACNYQSDKAIVFGGISSNHVLGDLFIMQLDDSKSSFSIEWKQIKTDSETSLSRCYHTANIYKNKMYVFGGWHERHLPSDELWSFNFENLTWISETTTGFPPTRRYHHCSVLNEDSIYIYGGSTTDGVQLDDLFTLNLSKKAKFQNLVLLARMEWQQVIPHNPSPSPRSCISAQIQNQQIYIFGGYSSKEPSINNELLIYNLNSNSWEKIPPNESFPEPRYSYSLICWKNKLLVFGGWSSTGPLDDLHSLSFDELEMSLPNLIRNPILRKRLLYNKLYSDISFQIGGQEIPAHKAILSLNSTFFRNMFSSGMIESQTDKILIEDIKPYVFKAMLEYIYCEFVDLTESLALDLLQPTDKYGLSTLKKICGEFLLDYITIKNFQERGEIAEKLEIPALIEGTISYIITNMKYIEDTIGLDNLPKSFLVKIILKQNQLSK